MAILETILTRFFLPWQFFHGHLQYAVDYAENRSWDPAMVRLAYYKGHHSALLESSSIWFENWENLWFEFVMTIFWFNHRFKIHENHFGWFNSWNFNPCSVAHARPCSTLRLQAHIPPQPVAVGVMCRGFHGTCNIPGLWEASWVIAF